MTNLSRALFAISLFSLGGCRTLDPAATKVMVLEKSNDNCRPLGVVNVDWSWWGDSTESLNAMGNQVAEKGGNALIQKGDNVGLAYFCPEQALR